VLDVPYLPQTEALCGGASAAMLFRYWGERHADIRPFEPLVDRRAGGIAEDVLVRAIRDRQWIAQRIAGTLDALRQRLAASQPPMLLLEDRPGRFHFVVAVGIDDQAVYLHDPTWGPSRRLANAELERKWKPANHWMLLVVPNGDRKAGEAQPDAVADARSDAPKTECDFALDAALDRVRVEGLGSADALLGSVMRRCPQSSAPTSELAGVRFAQKRLPEAIALAERAVRLNPADRYAWDVLGSSLFIQNDARGALRAWEHAGKPNVDRLRIEGLTLTRYSLVAETLDLHPNTLLTERRFVLAERRLAQLPVSQDTRLSYRPDAEGYATVDAVVVERPLVPSGPVEWGAVAARGVIDREISASIPGRTGQGELWTASYRWWSGRPRAGIEFAAPRTGWLPGVWRVDASWEAQTYQLAGNRFREEHVHGGLTIGDWLGPDLRYEVAAALDSWDRTRRAVSIGAALDRRLFADRISLAATGTRWAPTSGSSFGSASLRARFLSSPEPAGFVALAEAGIDTASSTAPLSLWSGAGEGRARPRLLRAHPLLDNGVLSGEVFGMTVRYGTAEAQRWLPRPVLARVGLAAFVDGARASGPLQIDTGIGIRLRATPHLRHGNGEQERGGTLRIDYAHGLRDGADAVTVGWQVW
jgi:predicted double-glycine peptidase